MTSHSSLSSPLTAATVSLGLRTRNLISITSLPRRHTSLVLYHGLTLPREHLSDGPSKSTSQLLATQLAHRIAPFCFGGCRSRKPRPPRKLAATYPERSAKLPNPIHSFPPACAINLMQYETPFTTG